MRNSADHRADDRGALIDAVRPRRNDVSDVVVDPVSFFNLARPLETHAPGRAIADRSVEIERPAGPEDAPFEYAERRIIHADVGGAKPQLVEWRLNVGIVEQAAIGPQTDQAADVGLLRHCDLPLRFALFRRGALSTSR